jgi:hypothetical protein
VPQRVGDKGAGRQPIVQVTLGAKRFTATLTAFRPQ